LRYFVEFAYNGSNYHGWQYQPNASSVQETMNKVFSTLLQHEIDIMGAGRTDSGVHAKQMYGHFDYDNTIDINLFIHRVNSFLPKDIVIYNIILVHESAHARFDAISRTYEYCISTYKNAFNTEYAWYFNQDLDIEAMNTSAKMLLNYIDFKCFSKSNTDVNTFNCKITAAFWTKEKETLIFTITADRFLRNMVRAIVGTLINVGLHKTSQQDFIKIIENRNREEAGFSVPAHGLHLTHIEYRYLNIV
jgi:tRNA pseudouridine38-40 synthase